MNNKGLKIKAIDILKIHRDCSENLGDDESIMAIYDEAIKELEDIQKLIESFDKKIPRGDKVFKIEIVDDLNQVVMENFK